MQRFRLYRQQWSLYSAGMLRQPAIPAQYVTIPAQYVAATGTITVAHCHTGYNPICLFQAIPQALRIYSGQPALLDTRHYR